MQLYMTAAPEQYRLLSGMPFRLSHLAYQIGTDGHLHRATVSRQMQSGLLALNDAMPPAISDPTALSREILRECMSRGYEGVAADFGGSTTPDRMVFLEEAAKLLHRNSKKLFLSAAYGRRIPTAYVLVNTAISAARCAPCWWDAWQRLWPGPRCAGHRAAAHGFPAALPYRRRNAADERIL